MSNVFILNNTANFMTYHKVLKRFYFFYFFFGKKQNNNKEKLWKQLKQAWKGLFGLTLSIMAWKPGGGNKKQLVTLHPPSAHRE